MISRAVLLCVLLYGAVAMEQKYKELLLKLHNSHREGEGASNMNELVWDDELEKEAADWARGCKFEHQMGERGENLAFDTNKNPYEDLIAGSFKGWFDEKNVYTWGQHSCSASCHYTQLVWSETRRVGCAMEECSNFHPINSRSWYLVCFYDPKGNTNGVKPYKKGAACSDCRSDQTCKKGLCSGGEDPCENHDANCEAWVGMDQCTANKPFMKDKCAQACGFCKGGSNGGGKGGSNGGKKDCEDSHRDCEYWASVGECSRNPDWMKKFCRRSCSVCSEECEDKSEGCARWAKSGQCDRNPGYMLRNCKTSCNKCPGSGGGKGDHTECYDGNGNCRTWAEKGECDKNPGWMHEYCKRSCGICAVCEDSHRDCEYWASVGECSRNPDWMKKFCRRSCSVCTSGSLRYRSVGGKKKGGSNKKGGNGRKGGNARKGGSQGGSKGGSKGGCKNQHKNCDRWAEMGFCEKRQKYMSGYCPVSCDAC